MPSAVFVPGAGATTRPPGLLEQIESEAVKVIPETRVGRSKEGMPVLVPDTARVAPMPTVRPPNRDPRMNAWPGNEFTFTIRGSATVKRDTTFVLPDSIRAYFDTSRVAPPAAPKPERSPSRP